MSHFPNENNSKMHRRVFDESDRLRESDDRHNLKLSCRELFEENKVQALNKHKEDTFFCLPDFFISEGLTYI